MSVLAMDCVMVGYGAGRVLGKVAIVDREGTVLLNEYIKPADPRDDYRSLIIGIKRQQLDNGKSFKQAQSDVFNLIKYNVLVCYRMESNLFAVGLNHPKCYQRDISNYKPFMKNGQPQSLNVLAKIYLNKIIHEEERDTVENARIVMELYELVADEWN